MNNKTKSKSIPIYDKVASTTLLDGDYITCIGSANFDYTFRLDSPLVMGTSNPVRSAISLGGVIRNVAENLARLDHKVSLMTVIGSDHAGLEILRRSRRLMAVFATDILKGYATGGYYAAIGSDGNMNVGFADMAINHNMNHNWIIKHQPHLEQSSWLIADMNVTKDALETLIAYAGKTDKKLAIIGVSGPKMKQMPDDLHGVEIVICNLDESQSYFHTEITDLKTIVELWIQRGVRQVIVTKGKDGAMYYDGQAINHQKAYVVPHDKVVDVTGAGDSFSAAVLHGLIRGEPLKTSIKYGAISSSLTIQSPYAVNPKLSMNLIKKELKKYEDL